MMAESIQPTTSNAKPKRRSTISSQPPTKPPPPVPNRGSRSVSAESIDESIHSSVSPITSPKPSVTPTTPLNSTHKSPYPTTPHTPNTPQTPTPTPTDSDPPPTSSPTSIAPPTQSPVSVSVELPPLPSSALPPIPSSALPPVPADSKSPRLLSSSSGVTTPPNPPPPTSVSSPTSPTLLSATTSPPPTTPPTPSPLTPSPRPPSTTSTPSPRPPSTTSTPSPRPSSTTTPTHSPRPASTTAPTPSPRPFSSSNSPLAGLPSISSPRPSPPPRPPSTTTSPVPVSTPAPQTTSPTVNIPPSVSPISASHELLPTVTPEPATTPSVLSASDTTVSAPSSSTASPTTGTSQPSARRPPPRPPRTSGIGSSLTQIAPANTSTPNLTTSTNSPTPAPAKRPASAQPLLSNLSSPASSPSVHSSPHPPTAKHSPNPPLHARKPSNTISGISSPHSPAPSSVSPASQSPTAPPTSTPLSPTQSLLSPNQSSTPPAPHSRRPSNTQPLVLPPFAQAANNAGTNNTITNPTTGIVVRPMRTKTDSPAPRDYTLKSEALKKSDSPKFESLKNLAVLKNDLEAATKSEPQKTDADTKPAEAEGKENKTMELVTDESESAASRAETADSRLGKPSKSSKDKDKDKDKRSRTLTRTKGQAHIESTQSATTTAHPTLEKEKSRTWFQKYATIRAYVPMAERTESLRSIDLEQLADSLASPPLSPPQQAPTPPPPSQHHNQHLQPSTSTDNLQAYADRVWDPPLRRHRKNLPSMSFAESFKPEIMYIVKEIIETEADYLDDIDITIRIYKDTLLQVLSLDDLAVVFINITDLYASHLKFMEDIVNEIISYINSGAAGCPPIAQLFAKMIAPWDIYTPYMKGHARGTQRVRELETNETFVNVTSSCRLVPESKNLTLDAYLIKPVQRLTKYPLLLRQLVKAVVPGDPQATMLPQAILQVENLVSQINTTISNAEALDEISAALNEAQYEHTPAFLEGRTVYRSGKLCRWKKKNNQKLPGKYWLLDTMLLGIEDKLLGKSLAVHIRLVNALQVLPADGNTLSILFISEEGKKETVMLIADSYLDKLYWLQDLEHVLQTLQIR